MYDGPFCVLSIVDSRTFKRLCYEVLDHDPIHDDIVKFFRRFRTELDRRGLSVQGITTDGSQLYPDAIKAVFPGAAHQVCKFHILHELTRAVFKALNRVRRELRAKQPALGRGRPGTPEAREAVRQKKRLQEKIADLFDHRYLFVQRSLSPAERKTLQRVTRGLPHLRAIRTIMDEVYRLFDRRCRTETALGKLARLRKRVRRFDSLQRVLKKLFSPNLEKALTSLNDDLLPATSNAVERGNRRYRKMQKTIYRVRTLNHIRQRIALDMQREAQAAGRLFVVSALHSQRREAS